MSAELDKFNQMYEYLSSPVEPDSSYGNFVFGRADTRLVDTMLTMHRGELAEYFLVSGGVGKDSADLEIPEATFIAGMAVETGIPESKIRTETKATNGGENARFGLEVIKNEKLALESLTVVAHATSLLRLSETLRHAASAKSLPLEKIYRVGTNYPFNPENPVDQKEVAAELLRLADWPKKDWLLPQPDIEKRDDLQNLVEFARTVAEQTPVYPPYLVSGAFRRMPLRAKKFIAKKLK